MTEGPNQLLSQYFTVTTFFKTSSFMGYPRCRATEAVRLVHGKEAFASTKELSVPLGFVLVLQKLTRRIVVGLLRSFQFMAWKICQKILDQVSGSFLA